MSAVIIAGDTSGTITLNAPAVAGTTTLTLPTTSGTILASGTAVTAAQGGTGLTSAGTAGNLLTSDGTTWTSAAAPSSTPTTAQVLTAIAGATAGAVGTYAFGLINTTASNISTGTNYAGSSIILEGVRGNTSTWAASDLSGTTGTTTTSGTWKALSNVTYTGTVPRATVFLRIA